MTGQTSKGTCTFCHRELSKASLTRHLVSCEQRIAMQGERESRQQATKIKAFHLVVEGYRLLMYWMHLEVAVDTTLATLDRFLRETWLECCGHLSVFRIGGYNYYVDAEMDAFWDMRRKNMQVMLEEVLSPGQTCSYEYDCGSTTELIVKVLAEQEVDMKGKAIQVLARNTLPIIPCDGCGGPVTWSEPILPDTRGSQLPVQSGRDECTTPLPEVKPSCSFLAIRLTSVRLRGTCLVGLIASKKTAGFCWSE